MAHPHQATIDLLHALVDRLPPRFPRELGRYLTLRLGEIERDASLPRDALDRVIAEFGKYTWHYRHAWEEAYQRDGAPMEERLFLEQLPTGVRERVLADIKNFSPSVREGERAGAGSIVRLPAFEERYTPEDRLVIEEALLRARRDAADRLARRILAGEILDYDAIALRWKRERLEIEAQLLALARIAREQPALAEEIAKVVADYEVGFSGLTGREPMLAELRGVVADYAHRT